MAKVSLNVNGKPRTLDVDPIESDDRRGVVCRGSGCRSVGLARFVDVRIVTITRFEA